MALLAGYAFHQYSRRSGVIKLLGWLLAIDFLANGLSFVLNAQIRNVPGAVFDFVLVFFLGWLYNSETNGKQKKYFAFCTIAYFIFGIYNLFFIQQLTISSYNKLIASFLIITYTIIFFYRLMRDMPERQVHHIPMFWFNSAFLIFQAGTLFLFAFTSYLINVLKNDLLYYMLFHNILSIVQHCIMFVGFRYDLRRLNRPDRSVLDKYVL